MRRVLLIPTVLVALLGFTGSAFADMWETADNYFDQREGDREAIDKARKEYKKILRDAEGADLLRAVTQLGRLAVYEGEMLLPKSAKAERLAIFSDCWCKDPVVSGIIPSGTCEEEGFVGKADPEVVGENDVYHYYRGVCLAYWGEQASLRQRLGFIGELDYHVQEGIENDDTRFEGAGIYRLGAGLYSNPATQVLGYYDPDHALELINKALQAGAYPGDPSDGSQYYDNFQGKVSVLRELGEDDEALDLTISILEELDELIEEEELPSRRVAEAMYNYKRLKQHYKELTGENW